MVRKDELPEPLYSVYPLARIENGLKTIRDLGSVMLKKALLF
jgi:hypothetical protein